VEVVDSETAKTKSTVENNALTEAISVNQSINQSLFQAQGPYDYRSRCQMAIANGSDVTVCAVKPYALVN